MARHSRAQTRTPLLLAVMWFAAAHPAAAKERPVGELHRHVSAGPVYALVELSEPPTAVAYALKARAAGAASAAPAARSAAVSQLARVQVEQDGLRRQVTAAHLAGTQEVYGLKRVYNGIVYRTDEQALAALRAMPGVKAVHRLTPMVPDNAVAVPLVGALQAWSNSTPFHGEGVRVGVIDTGIDYTHANFGGPGTISAYEENDKSLIEPGTFPTAKVVGGVDLAGAKYNASDPKHSTPEPDDDPLDGAGHGSHVAGTIAGYGVTRDGATFEGPWDSTLDPRSLGIGPGAAPAASLYAIKVFGDEEGTTVLSYEGLEWALDPNQDGDPSDHLDLVNLSLGAPYGTANDAQAEIFTNAVNAGMVVVASAGNEGDAYFITGAPGSVPAVISVAATVDGADPALQVNAPASLAGRKPIGMAEFGPAITTAITADVVAAAPYDACTITNGAALAGKIALVQRGGGCGFLAKTQAAAAAGAVSVIVVNTDDGLLTMTGYDPGLTITARLVAASDGGPVKAALDAGTPVSATLADALGYTPAADTIADFSSRGPTRLGGDIVLKPDVAAPGQAIFSTAMGTGTGGLEASGTSMAAPLTTGVLALLKQARAEDYGAAELKALLMNTAGHDVFDRPSTDPARERAGPGRVGAGRIDAAAALATRVIAYDRDAPGRVSVSFRTRDVDHALTETRTIRLSGLRGAAVTFTPSVDLAVTTPGTTVSVPSAPITIGESGGWADVAVTLSADPGRMTRARDASQFPDLGSYRRQWMSETSGWVVFTPQGGGQPLRVPFYAALTPAAQMSSTGHLFTNCEASGTASLALAGTGIDTRAGAPPPVGVVSLVTPFELAWASPQEDVGPWNNASLQYVGVTSNLPDAGNVLNSEIYFGVSTYGVWGSQAEMGFQVLIKRRSSPTWEYVLFAADLDGGGDVPVTGLGNLIRGGAARPEDHVNGLPASGYFLPAYLTDTIVLPVYATDLGLLDGGETAIDFQVAAFSSYGDDEPTTTSQVLHYDLARPAFAVGADPSLGLAGMGAPPLWTDAPGVSIPVAFDTRRQTNPASGMLLIHHHNAAGMRAEVVQAVCKPEPAAKSGCASAGGGALPSLLALGALLLRRKRRR